MSTHRAVFRASEEFIVSLIKGEFANCKLDGVPADAKFIAMHVDETYRTLSVILEHESFKPVTEGAPYEYLYPVRTRQEYAAKTFWDKEDELKESGEPLE